MRAEDFVVVSYNVENLFDCRHDSLKNDQEFLPNKGRYWTHKRLWKKLNDVARVIHQCGEPLGNEDFHVPDVVVMLEVENDSVMEMLTKRSMLRSLGYRYIMTSSPDLRGIDVAIMYNPLTFCPDTSFVITIVPMEGQRPTRDILCVKGHTRSNTPITIYGLHAPSRRGGETATQPYRLAVVDSLMNHVVPVADKENIIVAGDFNDYSYNKSVKMLASALTEVSEGIRGLNYERTGVKGTYFFHENWGSLDHVFVSPTLQGSVRNCYIFDRKWLLERNALGTFVPFRTYKGPKYNEGVSDHLPIVMKLDLSGLNPRNKD